MNGQPEVHLGFVLDVIHHTGMFKGHEILKRQLGEEIMNKRELPAVTGKTNNTSIQPNIVFNTDKCFGCI